MVIPKERRAQRLSVSLGAPRRGLVFYDFCSCFRAEQQQAAAARILHVRCYEYALYVIIFSCNTYHFSTYAEAIRGKKTTRATRTLVPVQYSLARDSLSTVFAFLEAFFTGGA